LLLLTCAVRGRRCRCWTSRVSRQLSHERGRPSVRLTWCACRARAASARCPKNSYAPIPTAKQQSEIQDRAVSPSDSAEAPKLSHPIAQTQAMSRRIEFIGPPCNSSWTHWFAARRLCTEVMPARTPVDYSFKMLPCCDDHDARWNEKAPVKAPVSPRAGSRSMRSNSPPFSGFNASAQPRRPYQPGVLRWGWR
jgi:hypothetical protein